jgi:transcriptional regulator with XRE-family HTH domain
MMKRGPRPVRKARDRRILLDLLRAVRTEAGLRQEDLAVRIGRRQAYVSKYELGERRLDLLELIAVCDALGISLSDFVRRFEADRVRAAQPGTA